MFYFLNSFSVGEEMIAVVYGFIDLIVSACCGFSFCRTVSLAVVSFRFPGKALIMTVKISLVRLHMPDTNIACLQDDTNSFCQREEVVLFLIYLHVCMCR